MDFTASTFVTILTAIGGLALIVSIITEVIKDVPLIKRIPTNLQVIILSLSLTIVSYFAYITYSETTIIWYYIVADVIAGFVVAYVTLYGWSKLTDLYKRFRNIPSLETAAKTSAKSVATDVALNSSQENKSPTVTEIQIPVFFKADAKRATTGTAKLVDFSTSNPLVTAPLAENNISIGGLITTSPTVTSEVNPISKDTSKADTSVTNNIETNTSTVGTSESDTSATNTSEADISTLVTPSKSPTTGCSSVTESSSKDFNLKNISTEI